MTRLREIGEQVLQRARQNRHFGMSAALASALVPPRIAGAWYAKAGLAEAAVRRAFDRRHYTQQVGMPFYHDHQAILHYFLIGSGVGLQPSDSFDPHYYRKSNPDIAVDGYEPFVHFCLFGQAEGRGGQAHLEAQASASTPPDLGEMFDHLRLDAGAAAIDIVMPVYGSRSLTLGAIDSVLHTASQQACELIVVDDASPDPKLQHELRQLADRGLITLLNNERNQGFAASVNKGIALHPQRDVILLNSDTRVFGDWIARLRSALDCTPYIGTVTPLSNAATILSYPIRLRDNLMSLEVDYPTLDGLCAHNGLSPIELPTGVGFCMAIKRRCLTQVGPFDVERFGKGYGEENDFCLRASTAGWKHVAASNILVWHRGGASFGRERAERMAAAQATIEALHPGYHAEVHDFIRQDPLRGIRAALDVARIAAVPLRKVLYLSSPDRTINAQEDELGLRLVPDYGAWRGDWRLVVRDLGPLPNLPRITPTDSPQSIARFLKELAIDEIKAYSSSEPLAARHITLAGKEAGIRVHQVASE